MRRNFLKYLSFTIFSSFILPLNSLFANKVAGISTTKLGAGDAMPFLKDIN